MDPEPEFPYRIRIFDRSGSGLRKKVRSGSGKNVQIRITEKVTGYVGQQKKKNGDVVADW